MPHGGYHGVVKVGDTIVQQGSPAGAPPGQGGRYNPQGYATEMAGSSAPSTTENIEKAIEDKKRDIKILNLAQEGKFGPNIDPQVDVIDQGFFPNQALNFVNYMGTGIAPNTVFPATGARGDTSKGLATLQNFANQQLNNLLIQQAQAEA